MMEIATQTEKFPLALKENFSYGKLAREGFKNQIKRVSNENLSAIQEISFEEEEEEEQASPVWFRESDFLRRQW